MLRISASSSSFIFLRFFPRSSYSPEVGTSRQPMMFIKVLFPEPEGPIMAI